MLDLTVTGHGIRVMIEPAFNCIAMEFLGIMGQHEATMSPFHRIFRYMSHRGQIVSSRIKDF